MEETNQSQEEAEELSETLETEIKAFAEGLPYWAKYVADCILFSGIITDDGIQKAYSYFLEEHGLKEATVKPEISIDIFDYPSSGTYKTDLLLTHVQGLEGVNALAEGQVLAFGENLTVVFGENGAGKSGYARLLKKAFYSKTPEDVLPNIYKSLADQKDLYAELEFSSGGVSYSLKYPTDAGNPEFRQFAIFDGKSVLRHLENRNEFEFRPAGLSFFSDFTQAITRVEEYLNDDIDLKSGTNNFPLLFEGDSPIKTFLNTLSKDSDINELKKHHPYSEEDKADKKKCQEEHDNLFVALKSQGTQIESYNKLIALLKASKLALESLNAYFDDLYLSQVANLISDCISKDAKAKEDGVENFKSDQIKEIGGVEWKQFIEAADAFAKLQKEEGTNYPEEGDSCLLCHQPLSDEAKQLVAKYWVLIKSQAEMSAKTANAQLDAVRLAFEKLSFDLFPADSILTTYLTANHLDILNGLLANLTLQKELCKQVISDISTKTPTKRSGQKTDSSIIDTVVTSIENDAQSFQDGGKSAKLAELGAKLTYYTHKEKLEIHLVKIELFINDQKWISMAGAYSWIALKQAITKTEKDLSGRYFNNQYIKAFNEECKTLNGSFLIDIDPKSSGAKSNRQLFIKGRSPSAILSEGEQKIIAIADFLAEMQMTDINKGIIFDDPVTSLDNTRKGEIAERLAHESTTKQVIIFTHDLVFVSRILTHCEDAKMSASCHWVEMLDGTPGHVWLNNTPAHEKQYRNANKARAFYDKAKVEGTPPEEREQLVKSGFAALRTCYEVLVIYGLFNNAVNRWQERVSILALKDIIINKEIIEQFDDSYDQCCHYMEGHTHSDRYQYKKPELENLNEEIIRFDAVRKVISDAKKSGKEPEFSTLA